MADINVSVESPEEISVSVEGGSGVSNFLGLTDTPSTYSGQSDKFIKVNTTEDGVEFTTSSSGGSEWGSITGTLSSQADLQAELDSKYDSTDFNVDWDTKLSTKDTGDLSEGINLYYTEARVSSNADVSANTTHSGLTTGNPHNVTLSDVGGTTDHTSLSNIGTNTHSQIDTHISNTSNPHSVDKSDVGLSNVANIDTTNASNISSGTLSSSILPPVALTTVQVASDESTMLALNTEEGDVIVRSDENKSYMRNNGVAGNITDFTELQTPTGGVLSVNGETGTVILTTGDVSEDVNKNYITDSEKIVLGNTSGTNTGDVADSSINHNLLLNTHNLTTDIDHNQLANFTTTEHFTQSEISIPSSQVSDFETSVSNNATVVSNTTKVSADGSINTHSDVDITTNVPAKNDHLIYNGSNFVSAPEGTTFTFSCTSFNDGESTTQLIGNGVAFPSDTMTYTSTYENGPPITSDVLMSINGGSYSKVGEMTASTYTSGTNTSGDINFPSLKDQYLRFRLDSSDGTDSDIDYDSAIYFRNYIRWGDSTTGASFTEATIEGLTGSQITSGYTSSRSISAGSGKYLVYAYPASYPSIHTEGFRFNSVTCPFSPPETISITNSAGYTENYKVFASTNTNLGNSTLTMSTSSNLIDPLYYGVTTKSNTYIESDINGLTNSDITNDNTQIWNSVSPGASEYMLFAFPVRLGIPIFYVGGFAGGFESPETVSITNINGYSEDYYVWRSTNLNLGATVVETKSS